VKACQFRLKFPNFRQVGLRRVSGGHDMSGRGTCKAVCLLLTTYELQIIDSRNERRLHSVLGYLTLYRVEQNHAQMSVDGVGGSV